MGLGCSGESISNCFLSCNALLWARGFDYCQNQEGEINVRIFFEWFRKGEGDLLLLVQDTGFPAFWLLMEKNLCQMIKLKVLLYSERTMLYWFSIQL